MDTLVGALAQLLMVRTYTMALERAGLVKVMEGLYYDYPSWTN